MAMPINSLAVPSPSLGIYQCNKCDMRYLGEQNFTTVSAPLCSISSDPTFYLWISFSKALHGADKYATSAGHLKFHFAPLVVSYKLPTVKSKTIGFLVDRNPTVHSSCLLANSTWVTSGERAAKQPLCWLFEGT